MSIVEREGITYLNSVRLPEPATLYYYINNLEELGPLSATNVSKYLTDQPKERIFILIAQSRILRAFVASSEVLDYKCNNFYKFKSINK